MEANPELSGSVVVAIQPAMKLRWSSKEGNFHAEITRVFALRAQANKDVSAPRLGHGFGNHLGRLTPVPRSIDRDHVVIVRLAPIDILVSKGSTRPQRRREKLLGREHFGNG